jgi:hypothetical protein
VLDAFPRWAQATGEEVPDEAGGSILTSTICGGEGRVQAARAARGTGESGSGHREHSNGENTRLRVRVEELENQKRLLEFENIGLESELRDSISGAVRERYVGWLRVVLFCEWRRA